MHLSCIEKDHDLTIQVEGELTFADYRQWRTMFEDALSIHPDRIVLDLTSLVTFDSAALGLILIFQAKAVNEAIDFVIIQPENGFMKQALNCADIQCVPGLHCGPKKDSCTRWEDVFGPLNLKERERSN